MRESFATWDGYPGLRAISAFTRVFDALWRFIRAEALSVRPRVSA